MIKSYPSGMLLYVQPTKTNLEPDKRGDTKGWTRKATRSNTRFLYSIEADKLTGYGYAFTLTIRDLPETPKDWSDCRKNFLDVCRRLDLLRYHWVNEWQRRGVPHLHGCLYFESEKQINDLRRLLSHWCRIAYPYGAKFQAQQLKPITDQQGWVKYLSKHASRGADHYQRANKPMQWAKTGRVWGKGGDWPTNETLIEIPYYLIHIMRRLIRNWRLADARQLLPVQFGDTKILPDSPLYREFVPGGFRDAKRIKSARKLLKVNDRKKSSVRGMSEWIGAELCADMLQCAESIHQTRLQRNREVFSHVR